MSKVLAEESLMFDEYNPNVVYRAFRGIPEHVKAEPPGHRLASSLFFSKKVGVSVYLGAETTLREIARKHEGFGVASVALSLLGGVEIVRDPRDTADDLPGHRVFLNGNRPLADELAVNARIEIKLPGYEVSGLEGSVGVVAPT